METTFEIAYGIETSLDFSSTNTMSFFFSKITLTSLFAWPYDCFDVFK